MNSESGAYSADIKADAADAVDVHSKYCLVIVKQAVPYPLSYKSRHTADLSHKRVQITLRNKAVIGYVLSEMKEANAEMKALEKKKCRN